MDRTAVFEEHRRLLFGIAYRMLGSVSDAEDLVQESYLRWQQADEPIHAPRAWLTTVITRLCINHLSLARVKRETYVGPWLPEPLIGEEDVSRLADSLSLAFLVLLETLSPVERAVFILREGFDCEFADIAHIVEKSEVNCRQILARARKHLDERRPRYEVSPAEVESLLQRLLTAVRNGDVETLIASMAENVVLVQDSGGKAGALPKPIVGAGPVARILINVVRRIGPTDAELRRATVNGLPGVVRFVNGRAEGVIAFGIAGGRIEALFSMTNPDKLRHLKEDVAMDDFAHVRYQVADVERSIDFYTTQLGFKLEMHVGKAFAAVSRGRLRLILGGPGSSGSRPMPDGRKQEPGGWNRILIYVDDLTAWIDRLKQAGVRFRNDVEAGPGGSQIQIEDPDGNPIELHQS